MKLSNIAQISRHPKINHCYDAWKYYKKLQKNAKNSNDQVSQNLEISEKLQKKKRYFQATNFHKRYIYCKKTNKENIENIISL